MSVNYVVRRSNGKIFATVENNVILGPNQPNNTPVPINLLGRNKVSYGQATNENFLWLSESFAGETAPRGSLKGLIWYNYISNNGQLLLALVDSARQPDPTKPETELDWASIPAITNFNTLPDADSSIMGRMVLTNNNDKLMVLMKDKEWREIQTTRPLNKEFDSLLDINYDTDKNYIMFTQQQNKKTISFFNNGGSLSIDDNGYPMFINGQGALHFDSNYFYELRVMARVVEEQNGELIMQPELSKTWIIKGSFYTGKNKPTESGKTQAQQVSDPRKIESMHSIIDVITQDGLLGDGWNIEITPTAQNSTLPSKTSTTKDGFMEYITASLNSKDHNGFNISCTMNNIASNANVKTQWSVALRMTGIPPIGV